MQDVLRKALHGPMTDEDYDQASSAFLGMGSHVTGAKLRSVIYDKRGLKGVLDVMSDPRQLLSAYNDSTSS
jgi:acetate kinase